MSETADLIERACPGAVAAEVIDGPDLTAEIVPERLVAACRFVKGPPLQFTLLSDVTCADFPDAPGRLRVAYHLFAPDNGARLRLRAWAGAGDPRLPSVTGVWATANWHEREVYDMFGVRFDGHPDLSRILMPIDWEGHPLRRDYPIGGEDVEFSDAV